MSTPRVFVSYAWDISEGEGHGEWVRGLCERLVDSGINVRLDQWHVRPGESFTHFMETEVTAADFILTICTPEFVRKSSERVGGVGYEQQIVSGHLVAGAPRSKFIPLLRKGNFGVGAEGGLPDQFRGVKAVDFRNDSQFEKSLEELARAIYDAPRFQPPKPGARPNFAPAPPVTTPRPGNPGVTPANRATTASGSVPHELELILGGDGRPLGETDQLEMLIDEYTHERNKGQQVRFRLLLEQHSDAMREFAQLSQVASPDPAQRERRFALRKVLRDAELLREGSDPWGYLADEIEDGLALIVGELFLKRRFLRNLRETVRAASCYLDIQAGRWGKEETDGSSFDLVDPSGQYNVVVNLTSAQTKQLMDGQGVDNPSWLIAGFGLRASDMPRDILIEQGVPRMVNELHRLQRSGSSPEIAKFLELENWTAGLH